MADLSCFATKDNADEGVVIPVQLDGMKMPLALKIFGSDSDVVADYERAKIRKLGIGRKGKQTLTEDDVDELLDNQDEAVIVRLGGIYAYDWKKKSVIDEDVILFDKKLGNDKNSYRYLIEKIPALKNWITERSNEREHFLSVGKKN